MVKTLRHLFTPQHSNNHRPKILHIEGFLLFTVIIVSAFLLTKAIPKTGLSNILGFASSITPSQVVEQTNGARASNGLGPLAFNGELSRAAQAKGSYMCAKQFWAHIAPDGTTPWYFIKNAGYAYSVAGENLARDFSDTGSMMDAWMASPTHRSNIVNSRYKDIGVAIVDCNFLGADTALVVQMFGTELTSAPATTKTAATTSTKSATAAGTSADKEVAGAESVPKLISNANPELKLESKKPEGTSTPRYFSPLEAVKAVMIAILALLMVVLFTDLFLEHKLNTVRLVGKNLAHLIFLAGILIVVLSIKAGIVY